MPSSESHKGISACDGLCLSLEPAGLDLQVGISGLRSPAEAGESLRPETGARRVETMETPASTNRTKPSNAELDGVFMGREYGR